jgi:hypothetical protein
VILPVKILLLFAHWDIMIICFDPAVTTSDMKAFDPVEEGKNE